MAKKKRTNPRPKHALRIFENSPERRKLETERLKLAAIEFRSQWATCPTKTRYATIEEAEAAAETWNRVDPPANPRDESASAYECPRCHWFHVGRPIRVKHRKKLREQKRRQ